MKKINLNLPEELLKRLDAYCTKYFTNRADVIRRALVEFFDKNDNTIE
jgi:metal-responsive CopG/Arc/MetJ family transcriptional regulator